jgi:methionyl-tRNA formyltransferase
LVASPVKQRALQLEQQLGHAIPLFSPERISRDLAMQAQLAQLGADLSVVVAFGQLLPPVVLQQPPLGCWNGHGSLLPRWRGAAPIQWALLQGDSQTGVGIMAMEQGLDTGPVLVQQSLPIGLLQNAAELGGKLSALTASLFVEALPRIAAAGAGPEPERLARLAVKPQGGEGICMARLLTKQDSCIAWQANALAIHRKVMGLYPGANSSWQGRRLKLLATEPLVAQLADQLSPEAAELSLRPWRHAEPGSLLEAVKGVGLVFATGGCPLLLREAQLEGKAAARGTALIQQLG